jgi:hypothetical protein
MTSRPPRKPKAPLVLAVNRLKIRIPWLFEAEGEGVLPVAGVLVLCLILVGWVVFR